MRKILNQSGVGVLEIMVLVGLIGSLSYFIMSKQKESTDLKSRTEYKFEIDNAEALIRDTLADAYSCTATVGPTTVGTIDSGGELLQIAVGRPGTAPQFAALLRSIVGVDEEIRPGILVTGINLVSDGSRDFIRVRFAPTERRKARTKSANEIVKNFYISGIKNGDVYSQCALDVSDEVNELNCTKILGAWNPTTKKCVLAGYYMRSVDTVDLYRTSSGSITTTPPTLSYESCECPRPERCSQPVHCCLPYCPSGTDMGTDFTKEYPNSTNNYQCVIKVSCQPRPFASAIKP